MEHYIPHKAVLREKAETTKLCIVYDASAKADESSPSINGCLETGPPLQRKIMNILIRTRFKTIFLPGDVKQAFLMIQIQEIERDAPRFIWIDNLQSKKLMIYRFERVLSGFECKPISFGWYLGATFFKVQGKVSRLCKRTERRNLCRCYQFRRHVSGRDRADETKHNLNL